MERVHVRLTRGHGTLSGHLRGSYDRDGPSRSPFSFTRPTLLTAGVDGGGKVSPEEGRESRGGFTVEGATGTDWWVDLPWVVE